MRRHSKKKNSIKIFIITTIAAAVLFGSFLLLKNTKNDETVATVNGEKILKSEFDQKLRSIFEGQNPNNAEFKPLEVSSLPKEAVEIIAKEIYIERELTKEAKKSPAAKLDVTKDRIADATSRILRQSYIDSLIKEKVTEKAINDKYVELTNEITDKKEYEISHIVVKTKEEAEKISKELSNKKSKFSDLARKYSLDKESGQKGGELGYILEDNIVKEISTELFKLKQGEISQPIETKFGWHLIRYTNTREAKALPFEEVKDGIREQLYQDVINSVNTKITKDIKVTALVFSKDEEKAKTEESKPANEENKAAEEATKSEETASENSTEAKTEENVKPVEEAKKEIKKEEKKSDKQTKSEKKSESKNKKNEKKSESKKNEKSESKKSSR